MNIDTKRSDQFGLIHTEHGRDAAKQGQSDELPPELGHTREILETANALIRSEPQKAYTLVTEILEAVETQLFALPEGSHFREACHTLQADIWRTCGICKNFLAEYDSATAYLERAQRLYAKLNNHAGNIQCLINLGMVCKNTGDYARAMEYYHKGLMLSQELSNRRGESAALLNIGNVYPLLGDYSRALEFYRRSLEINRAIGSRLNEAFQLGNIGSVYARTGNNRKALEYFRASLKIKKEIGDRLGQANMYLNIADACLELEMNTEAAGYADNCLEMARNIGAKSLESHALHLAGLIAGSGNNAAEALEKFEEALAVARDAEYTIGIIQNLVALGQQLEKNGSAEKALEILSESLQLAQSIKALPELMKIHHSLSEVNRQLGAFDKAFEHYRLYHDIEREVFNEETTRKTIALQTWHASEQALKEAEIYRLKNVELAEANDMLQMLNTEKNEFLGIAAHDLKNQLSVVILSANLLKKHGSSLSDTERYQHTHRIEATADHMRRIILKLLDINRLESGKVEVNAGRFDIATLCDTVVYQNLDRATQKGIRLLHTRREEAMYVYTDSEKIQVILENLVSNALKFSPPDSTVWLKTKRIKDCVYIEIRDQGPGFTDEDKQQLFRKFARLSAKPTGGEHSTGLGLSIVKKLADALQCPIRCESTKGKGSAFILELPLA